jgi:hypothetical protein
MPQPTTVLRAQVYNLTAINIHSFLVPSCSDLNALIHKLQIKFLMAMEDNFIHEVNMFDSSKSHQLCLLPSRVKM